MTPITEPLPHPCNVHRMDWFSIAFVGLAVIAAGFSVHALARARRNPANWEIDPITRNLHFQNWTEVTYAGLILLGSSGVIGLAVAL